MSSGDKVMGNRTCLLLQVLEVLLLVQVLLVQEQVQVKDRQQLELVMVLQPVQVRQPVLVGLLVLEQELVLQEQGKELVLQGQELVLQGQVPVHGLELGLLVVMTQLLVEMQCMYLMEQHKRSKKHRLKRRREEIFN